MSVITIPDALTALLAPTDGPVELRAADGRVLGRFTPVKPLAPGEPLIPPEFDLTPEEFNRRLAEPGLTIDEVRERLGWK